MSRTSERRAIDIGVASTLALIALALRWVFRARQPTEWDSIHYTRAIEHFDVVQYWPHAPGYWLYIFFGRVVHWLTPLNPHDSLLFVTAAASAAVVGFAYLIGTTVANRRAGVIAAAVLMTMPFMWFYGAMVSTKSFDSLVLVVLLYLAYRVRPGTRRHVVAAAVVLGLCAGIRQSAFVLFLPLVIYIAFKGIRSARGFVVALVAGAAAVAVWFVPMILEQPGGLEAIREQSNMLLDGSLEQTSILVGSPNAKANMLHCLGVTVTAVVALLPFVVISAVWRNRNRVDSVWRIDRWWLPLGLATLPGLFEGVAVHFSSPGYALSFLPGLVLACALLTARVSNGRAGSAILMVLTVAVVGFQVQRFVYAPYVMPQTMERLTRVWQGDKYGAPYEATRAGLLRIDREQLKYRDIANHFDPAQDVLVFDTLNGGERYRYVGWQLPEFTVHLANLGTEIDQARDGRHTTVADNIIEVPPGGSAVLVLNNIPPRLQQLLDAGQARAVTLATGPTVYAVNPGTTVLDLNLVTAPLPEI